MLPLHTEGGTITYKKGGSFHFVIDDAVPDNKYFCNGDWRNLQTLQDWLERVMGIVAIGCPLNDSDSVVHFSTDSFFTFKNMLGDEIDVR